MNQVAINMDNAEIGSEARTENHLNSTNVETIPLVNTGPSANCDPVSNTSASAPPTIRIVINVNGDGRKKSFLKYVRLVMDCIRTLASLGRLF